MAAYTVNSSHLTGWSTSKVSCLALVGKMAIGAKTKLKLTGNVQIIDIASKLDPRGHMWKSHETNELCEYLYFWKF